MFKAEVNRLSTLHIPTRQNKADLPWITHEIVNVIRKRDLQYIKLKMASLHKSHHTEKLKIYQFNYTKQIWNAYWSYLESVIFSDTSGSCHKKTLNRKYRKHRYCTILEVKLTQIQCRRPMYSTNNLNPSFQFFATQSQTISKHYNVNTWTSTHATNDYHRSRSW